ncbi:DUF885 domain-containing protein [Umezawaea beigongshangensis]|uniref:DUF885 domain-containing protein n=1 Tax=Umezawaea beigongshangensis TaxID=2780383 RepID=UPI001E565BEA|nr:DUF885 domain-containing protein [Umezawaea beigongshangensis]
MGESLVRDYLLLGLRLGRLVDGFVDCWFGDPELSRQVDDEPLADPAVLAASARALRAELASGDLSEARRRFLDGQLGALACAADRLAGVEVPFLEEVRCYFDVDVELTDVEVYAAIHDEISALLPGSAPLHERVTAFQEHDRVPRGDLLRATQAVSEELRTRARALFDLPEDESVEYEAVTDRPWNAFNRYRGGFRSTITLNADVRHRMAALPLLVTHEAYPGHHAEHCRKERVLVHEQGHGEQTIALVNTPQCLMAEGIAEAALPAVLGQDWGRWTQDLLAELGLVMDGELSQLMLSRTTLLMAARQDAAVLLHDRGAAPEDVVTYLRRWMLVDERRAEHAVRFLTDPLWRAYTTTYVEGSRRVRAWLDARPEEQSVATRYRRLLDEPLVPADLVP